MQIALIYNKADQRSFANAVFTASIAKAVSNHIVGLYDIRDTIPFTYHRYVFIEVDHLNFWDSYFTNILGRKTKGVTVLDKMKVLEVSDTFKAPLVSQEQYEFSLTSELMKLVDLNNQYSHLAKILAYRVDNFYDLELPETDLVSHLGFLNLCHAYRLIDPEPESVFLELSKTGYMDLSPEETSMYFTSFSKRCKALITSLEYNDSTIQAVTSLEPEVHLLIRRLVLSRNPFIHLSKGLNMDVIWSFSYFEDNLEGFTGYYKILQPANHIWSTRSHKTTSEDLNHTKVTTRKGWAA